LLFIDVGMAKCDYDGIDGDIHHNHIKNLQSNPQTRDRNYIKPPGTDSKGLEKSIQDAEMRRDRRRSWIADIQEFESCPVDAVENYDHEEKPPSWGAREEVCVDSARIAEDEAEGGFVFWKGVWGGVEEAEEFEEGPEN
jgi:hypothetical protein